MSNIATSSLSEKDKIVLAQTSVLITSITETNFKQIVDQIHYILGSSTLYREYLRRLILICLNSIQSNSLDLSQSTQHLLQTELSLLTRESKLDTIGDFLGDLLELFTLEQLLTWAPFNNFEKLYFALCIPHQPQFKDQFLRCAEQAVSLDPREIPSTFSATHCFARLSVTDLLPKEHQLQLLLTFCRTAEIPELVRLDVLRSMSFKHILQSTAPADLKPDSFLQDLLKAQSKDNLNDALALLFAEIISPGSQGLCVNNDNTLTGMTPLAIPEAAAKGALLRSLISHLPRQPNWNRVFNLISTKYFMSKTISPTVASISEILSAIEETFIDAFISFDWDIAFKYDLFMVLRNMAPASGAFDISKVLQPLDSKLVNDKQSLLYFKSMVLLELDIFVAREDLQKKRDLQQFDNMFLADFQLTPELFALSIVGNMSRFKESEDALKTIDGLLLPAMKKMYHSESPQLKDVFSTLPLQKVLDFGKIVLEQNDAVYFCKFLLENNKLDTFLDEVSLVDALKFTPFAIVAGWDNFKTFIQKHIRHVDELLNFLAYQQTVGKVGLDLVHIHMLNEILSKAAPGEKLEAVQMVLLQKVPRLINFGHGNDIAVLANAGPDYSRFAPDVEGTMKDLYQNLYKGAIETKDIIVLLAKLKSSRVPRDQDVFCCVIHSLIDEYKYFSTYPMEMLAITSVLFGSIINFHLVEGFVLDVFLKLVLKSAHEPAESNMHKFAIQAIYAFRGRLADFPDYCRTLLKDVPALNSQRGLVDLLHAAIQQSAPVTVQSAYVHALPLVGAEQQTNPPQEIIDKVHFIINSTSADNFATKSAELKKVMTPAFFSWFANDLVVQRARTESNFHKIYADLIFSLDSHLLYEYVLQVTYQQIGKFVAKPELSVNEKGMAKKLGSWLGHITIAVDRPIRYNNFAVRELLLEAFQTKRLESAIAVVTKLMEESGKSKIFKSPNPWTNGILEVLMELRTTSQLTVNQSFQIEIMMKTLKLDVANFPASHWLEHPTPAALLAGDVEQPNDLLMQQQLASQRMQQQQQSQPHQHMPEQHPMENIPGDNPFAHLIGHTAFVTAPEWKRVFQMALAKSVREIIVPAVDKSAGIAVITARSIIMKDFVTESDEMKFRGAAYSLVRTLSKSLAQATSIDLLKEAIYQTTLSLAPNLPNVIANAAEELQQAVNDNVVIALSIIEKATMERACKEIDETLINAINQRRAYTEQRPEHPFYNGPPVYSMTLPEPLGLNNNGVSKQQLKLYEDFGQFFNVAPGMAAQAPPPIMGAAQGNQPAPQIPLGQQLPPPPTQSQQPQTSGAQNQLQPQQPQASVAQAPVPAAPGLEHSQEQPMVMQVPNFEQVLRMTITLVEALAAQLNTATAATFQELPADSPIKVIFSQTLNHIARNGVFKDQICLKLAQSLVNNIFTSADKQLSIEVYTELLDKICILSASTKRDVVWWLSNSIDVLKYSATLFKAIYSFKLVSVPEIDLKLAAAVEEGRGVDFAIKFVPDVLQGNKSSVIRSDFAFTIDALRKSTREEAKTFIQNMDTSLPPVVATPGEKLGYIFAEWVKLVSKNPSDDALATVFVAQMVETGVIEGMDNTIQFLKTAIRLSVIAFKESDPSGEVFMSIDALSKLIVRLLLTHEFESHEGRSEYFKLLLTVVTLEFARDHAESGAPFNERPYFRLFSTLLAEWAEVRNGNFIRVKDEELKSSLKSFDNDFYLTLAKFFNSYQPAAFPGFAFAWMSLISHRMFMPMLLTLPDKKGWSSFALLLIDLLNFMAQYSTANEIPEVISVIYRGCLRIFLLILHDFPEFFVENHSWIVSSIPSFFTQLKNLILSAFPMGISIPDPFTRGLQMASVELVKESPKVKEDPVLDMQKYGIKKCTDNYLRIPSSSLLKNIQAVLNKDASVENGIGYSMCDVNIRLVNSLVLYVVIQAASENDLCGANSTHYQLLSTLLNEGSVEIKFQMLQAVANQLRYPNSHTLWAHNFILQLFSSSDQDTQELVVRVLLERMLGSKPHPWGVVVTFNELLRNGEYKLFDMPFVKETPEIQQLFGVIQSAVKA